MIDTGKVADRRSLRFPDIDALLAEIDRLVAADKTGTLRQSGNWTAGQNFGHLAAWIEYGYEGFPFKTPWLIRVILRSRLPKYLSDGMRPGVRIPKVKAGTYGVKLMSTDAGADRLRRALQRLRSGEPAKFDSPAFGAMPHDQRITLTLRHAELHLGFLHP